MRYRVEVAGKTFEVVVEEGPEGTRAALAKPGEKPALANVKLIPWLGPLHALVRPEGMRTVSARRGLRENEVEVRLAGGRPLTCSVEDERARLARLAQQAAGGGKAGPRMVVAVMPGIVLSVAVEVGSKVALKGALLVVEAMKMQNEIRAEVAGVVSKVLVKPGQSVAAGAPLVEITPESAPSS